MAGYEWKIAGQANHLHNHCKVLQSYPVKNRMGCGFAANSQLGTKEIGAGWPAPGRTNVAR